MKIVFGLCCILLPLLGQASATQKYLDLIHQISRGEACCVEEVDPSILSPNCRKVFNGKIYAESREEFISDLIQVYKTNGSWEIRLIDQISSSENDAVVLHLMIDVKKFGMFTAMVILRFDSDGLIAEINEVFSKCEGLSLKG